MTIFQNVITATIGGVEVSAETVDIASTDDTIRKLKIRFPSARIQIKEVEVEKVLYTG